MEKQNFRVDLSGLVELLSRNLYSGPRVFIRELLQNGCDAITARQEIDPNCPTRIRCVTSGSELRLTDTGVGLTLSEAQSLLATIGASSKRDELGMARSDFLGQFGIGLLSCFMVSSTITVYSRSARYDDSPVICWRGHENGTWEVSEANPTEIPAELRHECGTCIVLTALPGEKHFDYAALSELISHYGHYLPVHITLERDQSSEASDFLSCAPFPWELEEHHAARWCMENYGFMPFAAIPLEVPIAGVRGTAFVLASGAAPGQSPRHHVYLRRMLVSKKITDLLPEWAYFVRVIIDTEHLKPTASREQLFDDELLEATRHELGQQIRRWMTRLAEEEPEQFRAFTSLHLNGLKSLALTDEPTRSLVSATVHFHTSLGWKTLDEVMREHGAIRFTPTDNEFRTLEPVAAANGLCIVNAGFAFDEELLGQLALDRPEARITRLDPVDVLGVLTPVSGTEAAAVAPFIDKAHEALKGQDVLVEVRSFVPSTMPVLYLPDSDMAGRAIEDEQAQAATGAFSGLIEAIQSAGASQAHAQSRLIFNAHAPIVAQLRGHLDNSEVLDAAIRGFYVQALLAGRHTMNAQARSWATSVFTSLITHSIRPHPADDSTL